MVTIGERNDPAALKPQPPNVHVENYVPQSLLLPHCDAVVTHGGHNTVLGALSFGLALVVIPFYADNPTTPHAAPQSGSDGRYRRQSFRRRKCVKV